MKTAERTDLLIIVGTSGATNLPNQVAWLVEQGGGIMVDINAEENPFSQIALRSKHGYTLQQSSSFALPMILETFKEGL